MRNNILSSETHKVLFLSSLSFNVIWEILISAIRTITKMDPEEKVSVFAPIFFFSERPRKSAETNKQVKRQVCYLRQ